MFCWREEVVPGVWAAFTNTDAGNLALHAGTDRDGVQGRRRQVEDGMGVKAGSLMFMNQTHSNAVVDAEAVVRSGVVPEADAIVSGDGRHPLAVLIADCVPVVLAATASTASGRRAPGPIGVIHAGRRGVLDGVVGNAVGLLRELGAREISAWIGPSICGRCYEVPAAMRDQLAAVVPESGSQTRWGTPGLDLPRAVHRQLQLSGVEAEFAVPLVESEPRAESERQAGDGLRHAGEHERDVVEGEKGAAVQETNRACTLENGALFSYRRNAATGRFAGLIWRDP